MNTIRAHALIILAMLTSACASIEPIDTSKSTKKERRALTLASTLADSQLKRDLQFCADKPLTPTPFSISHRGAPLGFPEHTKEGYIAAAKMGAGIIECDVTFTKDEQLVCRHSQCDLHTTTNILLTPLARQCTTPFTPAHGNTPAQATCCTSDITLAQFQSLCGRRDKVNPSATTIAEYLVEPPSPVVDEPLRCGTLMTHAQSIELIDSLGADFTPELKNPQVDMPFNGTLTMATFADRLLKEYEDAGIDPTRIYPQSFDPSVIQYWLENHPTYSDQLVLLDGRDRDQNFQPSLAAMQSLADKGVKIVAPPMPMLLKLDTSGALVASDYAKYAKQAGLQIITWTFESGVATDPNNWLYTNLSGFMTSEAKMLEVLHALHTEVGIVGIFSDWPGTITYYANCMNIRRPK